MVKPFLLSTQKHTHCKGSVKKYSTQVAQLIQWFQGRNKLIFFL